LKPETTKDTYQGLLGLDGLSKELKTLNWIISIVVATYLAFTSYFRVEQSMRNFPLLDWLAVASPICIAVAWLRLTGVKWRYALLLFVFVPIIFMCILFILSMLIGFFMAT
jgi:hypothetical protein